MAKRKSTRTRKRVSSYHHFPEVKGKVVELVEIDQDANAILILFDDDTALSFDLDSNHVVFPELSHRTMAVDPQPNIYGQMAVKTEPAERRVFCLTLGLAFWASIGVIPQFSC
jgi:hypothetical protein